MSSPEAAQVTVAPRCTKCGTCNNVSIKTQRMREGVEYQGVRCAAKMQWRRCRDCGHAFCAIKVGSPIPKAPASRWTGPMAQRTD